MNVIIGVDPHKATHHVVAVSDDEHELAQVSVRACRTQTSRLVSWAEPFPSRTWAIEGADGLGYLLSQQLVAAGERVVDVPATLAARTRVLSSSRSNKNDPNDARAVALTALRHNDLREVRPVGHSEVLRLLAKRNKDIGDQRTRLVGRMHALLVEMAPGGIAKEINASDVDAFLARLSPTSPVEQMRFDLAVELLDDIRRLDAQLKASHKRIRTAVVASSTSLTDIFGVGPVLAAMLIGYSGDITRFRTRDHYAAYNGTAPAEFSSGGRVVHRVSTRGNRQLNHAIHMAAICQMRHPDSDGRIYVDRKVAEGKTKREAIRSLKRHISNTVYRHLIADARTRTKLTIEGSGRTPGNDSSASAAGSHPYRPALRRSHSRTPPSTLRLPTTSADPTRPSTGRDPARHPS
jgi:transposase